MKKPKQTVRKTTASQTEFRPYRVLFLVVVVAVTCLVLLAALGVSSEA